MLSSVELNLPKPLAFVCHDAGAANHIFSWITARTLVWPGVGTDWRVLLAGPAEKLWLTDGFPEISFCESVDELLDGAEVLLSGTGWASNIEYDAIKLAREREIRVIAVIDHWTNYRARFVRNEVEVFPNEIWVTDHYAKKLANIELHGVDVIQMPNVYLENAVKAINRFRAVKGNSNTILYVLEPIRGAWDETILNGEFQALDYFVKNLPLMGLKQNPLIRLRPHPSDAPNKYDAWINRQKKLNIMLDKAKSLEESIACSDAVVGCQTYAMIIALAAGKKVFTSIPAWAPPCILPHEGIHRISELKV